MTDESDNLWDAPGDEGWIMTSGMDVTGIIDTDIISPVEPHSSDASQVLLRIDYLQEIVDTAARLEGAETSVWLVVEDEKPAVIVPRSDTGLGYTVCPRQNTADVTRPLDDLGVAESELAEEDNVKLKTYVEGQVAADAFDAASTRGMSIEEWIAEAIRQKIQREADL